MTDIPENLFGNSKSGKNSKRVCHVAYTLNNSQPVACTIIGDQPLFYMDYEEDIFEDEFLNEEEIEILEREVNALRKEIASLERSTDLYAEDEEEKRLSFVENAMSMFDEKSEDDAENEKSADPVQTLVETLSKSRLAKAYLETMEEYNVSIVMTGEVENAYYDRQSAKILINDQLEFSAQILLAARELRRHWQHRQGALIHPLMLDPDSAVLINRVQVCDLVVSMIRIAWELQLTGEKSAWENIEDSSMADLGRAFAREAFLDFRTINNGVASASVFEAWFLTERCMNEDRVLIQQMLADHQGFVFDLDGPSNYLGAELISAIGAMPYGKNYLAQHAATIMNDPVFTDIRDRSNANFLWFIKFERSFRETEQKLQNPSDLQGRDTHHTPASQTKGSDHATFQSSGAQNSADIIQLYEADESSQANDKAKRLAQNIRRKPSKSQENGTDDTNGAGADIVFLNKR